jgi:hypothetical protein
MNISTNKHLIELSDIFKSGSEYVPKYPEKVTLPLVEFKEFYFKSAELKNLNKKEKKWLATMDVLACVCAVAYEKNIHDVVSAIYHGDFSPLYEDYRSKLSFLEQL